VWADEDGRTVFEHRKWGPDKWSYRHKVAKRNRTTLNCPEHEGVRLTGSGWCSKLPAAADNLMWNMPDLVPCLGDSHGIVLWMAGEKDAEAAQRYADRIGGNVVATTVHQGESRSSTLTEGQKLLLTGAECEFRLYYDRDPTGIRNVLARYDALEGLGVGRIVIRALPGEWLAADEAVDSAWTGVNDVSDLLAMGGSLRQCETVEYEDLRGVLGEEEKAGEAGGSGSGEGAGPRRTGAWRPFPGTEALRYPLRTEALLRAVRAVRPDAHTEDAGGKPHIQCPMPGHEDLDPSFTVTAGKNGALLITCTCDPSTGKGAGRMEWVRAVATVLDIADEYLMPLGDLDRADDTRARVFCALFRDRLLYLRETEKWIHWNDQEGVWSADESVPITALRLLAAEFHEAAECIADEKLAASMHSFAVNGLNASKMRETLSLAAKMPGMHASVASMDADPDVLTFRNCTVELTDNGVRVRGHRAADRCMLSVPYEYDARAHSDRWETFLEDVLPSRDNREFIQRVAGYVLHGGNPERALFFVTGPTSTGKTTFTSILMDALGSGLSGTFQLSMFRTKRDDAPRPDILKAMPRRLIVAEEGSSEWNLHADVIKAMTSGGRIEARGMRSNEYAERVPAFTPILCTNEWPEIKHADNAVKRRVIGIPFVTQIDRESDNVRFARDFTPDDYRGVLAWAVRGWEMYCQHRFTEDERPRDIREVTGEIHDSMAPVDRLINECCLLGPQYETPAHVLYDFMKDWWKDNGIHGEPPNSHVFGREITERTGYRSAPRMRSRNGIDGIPEVKSIRIRRGIKLLAPDEYKTSDE
jgi:P4 family phage/plasmid primase-like protien